MKVFIDIVKVGYRFTQDDGNVQEVQGIELRLAPKVKKFISMNRDNLELLDLMQNGLGNWYKNAEVGDDIIVSTSWDSDKVVSSRQIEIN